MNVHTLRREQLVPRPLEDTFAFFAKPENLNAITPPWLNFHIVELPEHLDEGSLIRYQLRWHGIPLQWIAEIQRWNPPIEFVDVQLKGPYRLWHHQHEFQAVTGGTLVRDTVRYSLPLGWLGEIAHRITVAKDVARIFDFRAREIAARLAP